MLKNNKNHNLYEYIINEIKNMINKNELHIGDVLPSERDLAERFNVSRVPIREAMKIMEYIGMIEVDSVSKKVLKKINMTDLYTKISFCIENDYRTIIELFDLRLMIEPEAARLASENLEKEDILTIKNSVERMKLSQDEMDTLYEASMQTHYAIIKSSKNQLLCSIYQGLYEHLLLSKSISMDLKTISQSIKIHEQIADAIINRKPEEAKELMYEHLIDAKQRFIQRYKTMNLPFPDKV